MRKKQQTKMGGKKRKKIRREKRWKKYKQSHNKRNKNTKKHKRGRHPTLFGLYFNFFIVTQNNTFTGHNTEDETTDINKGDKGITKLSCVCDSV